MKVICIKSGFGLKVGDVVNAKKVKLSYGTYYYELQVENNIITTSLNNSELNYHFSSMKKLREYKINIIINGA
jgi:hypothetical protein